MLLSHQKKFIYFKTKKTASTSVELFFERFCSPQTTKTTESTEELISEYGIVGSRMSKQKPTDSYYNHMPAKNIYNLVGPEIFNNYHKFAVVRNPYSKVLSMFWWYFYSANQLDILNELSFKDIKKKFRYFVLNEIDIPLDKEIYTIDGKIVADRILRYENLLQDLKDCCNFLEISFEEHQLKRFKSVSLRTEAYQDYYDEETIECVRKHFNWELKTFSYIF